MADRAVNVLWEDQYDDGQSAGFGPGRLLVACLAKRRAVFREPLGRASLERRVKSIPKKGNGKLKAELAKNARRLGAPDGLVVAFDSDEVRSLYGLAHGACKRTVTKAINEASQVVVEAVLVEENLESIVSIACRLLDVPVPTTKKRNERDLILGKLAQREDLLERFLEESASFRRLVEKVDQRLF